MKKVLSFVVVCLFVLCFAGVAVAIDESPYITNKEEIKTIDTIRHLDSIENNSQQSKDTIENLKNHYLSRNPDVIFECNTLTNVTSTPPILVNTNVPRWEINVPTNIIISMTFDKQIKFGNKKISLWSTETFEDKQIDIYIKGNILYIDPLIDLDNYTKYMIDIDDAAIADLSGLGNESITYSFRVCGCPNCTGSVPQLVSTNVQKWAINIPIDTTISFSFDQPINFGNADITIYNYDNLEDIELNTTITGNTLFLNPKNNLDPYQKYMISIEDAAICNMNCMGNESITYSFTTSGNTSEPLFGDMNGDNAVDISDLLWMASLIGPVSSSDAQKADTNDDMVVNILDLLEVKQSMNE